MKTQPRIVFVISTLLLLALVASLAPSSGPIPARAEPDYLGDPCHIAVTVVNGTTDYDIAAVGVSSYINWLTINYNNVPPNIEHVNVLRVREDLYMDQYNNLTTLVPSHPGQVWIIGNEPDVPHGGQDNLLPEVYAQRFYDFASRIRDLDSTARIGFAPIAQPTPLRLKYLDRVFARLSTTTQYGPPLAGGLSQTLALIDIFTIHGFTVNEGYREWGAGIPAGFAPNDPDAYKIDIWTELYKTHDINLFSTWVTSMRVWMRDHGARGKPLWVTEYGSLMPPLDPPGADFFNVSDEDSRDYMLATFSFIYNTTSTDYGYPADNNRLVQRGYWYSLNERRDRFGGSLFDPINKQRTIIGDAFVEYDPPVPKVNQDPYLVGLNFVPLKYSLGSGMTRVDYRIDVRVGNFITTENRVPIRLNLSLDGSNPPKTLSGYISRCGGAGNFSFFWNDLEPLVDYSVHLNVEIDPTSSMQDLNLSNNTIDSNVVPTEPSLVFLPEIIR